MKRRFKRRLCALIAGVVMLTSTIGTQLTAYADSTPTAASQTSSYKLARKNLKTYFFTNEPENTVDMPVYYFDGGTVPYLRIEDFAGIFQTVMAASGQKGLGDQYVIYAYDEYGNILKDSSGNYIRYLVDYMLNNNILEDITEKVMKGEIIIE